MREALALAAMGLAAGFSEPPPRGYSFHTWKRDPVDNTPSNKRAKVKAARKANVRRMQRER